MVDNFTIWHLWPETALAILAIWIIVVGAFQRARWWWTIFSLAGYSLVGLIILYNEPGVLNSVEQQGGWYATGPIVIDELGFVLRLLGVLVGILFTLIAAKTVREELASEYIGLLMLLIAGVMLVARANDLVLMFVSLELISIPTYVLLYLGRRDRATSEATAKYFFLSIMSSAVLLYGMSFLYGLAGTATLVSEPGEPSIAAALAREVGDSGLTAGLAAIAVVLLVAGIGFKIAAVPFHFYAPDVYQGATNGNAAILSVAPKIGGLAALIRILVVAMPGVADITWQLLLVISIASMTLGNVCALWQNNIRRMMAFSSVAHAGYMLIGVVVAVAMPQVVAGSGVGAAVLYLMVYSLASVGIFAALAYLGGIEQEVNAVADLSGLGKTQPVAAAVLAICLVSLAGIPPLAGFWGKLTLFAGALGAGDLPESGRWFLVLAIAGALNAAIASAYYLRVIATMYFGSSQREYRGQGGWGAQAAMVIAAALVVGVGVFPRVIMEPARRAELTLLRPGTGSGPAAVAGRLNVAQQTKLESRANASYDSAMSSDSGS